MKHYLLLIPLLLGVMACNDSYGVVVTNPEVEASDSYRKGNSYQRDFLLFADMLENTHPLFAETDKPHFDMDSLTRAGYQDLTVKARRNLSFICKPFCHVSTMDIPTSPRTCHCIGKVCILSIFSSTTIRPSTCLVSKRSMPTILANGS